MSSTASILYCYEAAQECEKDGNLLGAARNYYECYLYYENAELTVAYENLHEYGSSSMAEYHRCVGLMSLEDRAKIRTDMLAMSFLLDWEEKINYLDWVSWKESGTDSYKVTQTDEVSKAIEKTLVLTGKVCPYCGKPTELVDSAEIYGGTSYGPVYLCRDCNAYVGCYKGTTTALGRLANEDLRLAKRRAHHYLDQLWKNPRQRLKIYGWLSDELHIPHVRTHIGMSDIDQCNRIASLCRRRLVERHKRLPFRRFKEWEEPKGESREGQNCV